MRAHVAIRGWEKPQLLDCLTRRPAAERADGVIDKATPISCGVQVGRTRMSPRSQSQAASRGVAKIVQYAATVGLENADAWDL